MTNGACAVENSYCLWPQSSRWDKFGSGKIIIGSAIYIFGIEQEIYIFFYYLYDTYDILHSCVQAHGLYTTVTIELNWITVHGGWQGAAVALVLSP